MGPVIAGFSRTVHMPGNPVRPVWPFRVAARFSGNRHELARWGSVYWPALMLAVLGRAAEQAEQPARSARWARARRPTSGAPARAPRSPATAASPGSPGSDILRNEHTTWISDDRHSRAYQVLFDARSERIARNLAARPGPSTRRPTRTSAAWRATRRLDPRPRSGRPRG